MLDKQTFDQILVGVAGVAYSDNKQIYLGKNLASSLIFASMAPTCVLCGFLIDAVT
jgi:hypothetical protein